VKSAFETATVELRRAEAVYLPYTAVDRGRGSPDVKYCPFLSRRRYNCLGPTLLGIYTWKNGIFKDWTHF